MQRINRLVKICHRFKALIFYIKSFPPFSFLFSRSDRRTGIKHSSRREMCKCWGWQEPFFKRTPRSPPPHRRGWQRCDWAHKLSNSICLSWHFHSDPGSTDGQRLVGKKTALYILWHKPPPVSPRSVQNPLGTPFSHLFSALLCLLRHIKWPPTLQPGQ